MSKPESNSIGIILQELTLLCPTPLVLLWLRVGPEETAVGVTGFDKRHRGLEWGYREAAVHAAVDQILIWGGEKSIVSVIILQINVNTHFALHKERCIVILIVFIDRED